MSYPAPSAAFRRVSFAPPGALIPPPDETTAACIEAALAHAEHGMAVLRIALSIHSSRHLRHRAREVRRRRRGD